MMDEVHFLIDENISPETVAALQSSGYQASSLTAYVPLGSSDIEIAQAASETDAIIVTQDLDFGEMCFNAGAVSTGVIVLRLRIQTVENVTSRLLHFLMDAERLQLDLQHYLILVDDSRFRTRRRPE